MEQLLKYILEKLVSTSDKIKIEKKEEDSQIIFTITLDDEDKGRIIGKGGRNIKAIRDILVIIAKQNRQRVFLKVE